MLHHLPKLLSLFAALAPLLRAQQPFPETDTCKLRVFIGTQDTFRLEGACKLLAKDLQELGSDAQVVFAEGRDHGTLFQSHAELWPDGLLLRIHREMRASFDARVAAK